MPMPMPMHTADHWKNIFLLFSSPLPPSQITIDATQVTQLTLRSQNNFSHFRSPAVSDQSYFSEEKKTPLASATRTTSLLRTPS
jgi:hypothetical protein